MPDVGDRSVGETAARIVGADKILFGTDHPLLKPTRYFREIDASPLSEEDQALIKGGNAARLLGLTVL